jgi:hypothetical protein
MDACIEYVTTVYQAEEDDAILYCRETCVPLKHEDSLEHKNKVIPIVR